MDGTNGDNNFMKLYLSFTTIKNFTRYVYLKYSNIKIQKQSNKAIHMMAAPNSTKNWLFFCKLCMYNTLKILVKKPKT